MQQMVREIIRQYEYYDGTLTQEQQQHRNKLKIVDKRMSLMRAYKKGW
jgi:hypothetical protein